MIDLKTLGSKRGSRRNHKKGISLALKDLKRSEALARQETYNKLTITQKLSKLDSGGYHAKKQRAKLNALLGSNKL
jgi:hypothetical protein